MSDQSEWIDPRLTVFLIWGVCVTIFLCYPSKHIVFGFCKRLGFPCCANYEPPENSLPQSSDEEIAYELLSDERKHEIDSLRSIALLRYLRHFSMTISKNDMLRRKSLSRLYFNESQVSTASDPQCRDEGMHIPDVENGLDTSTQDEVVDVPLNNEEEYCDTGQLFEVTGDYTHIKMPCPGRGVGMCPRVNQKASKVADKPNKRGIFVRKKDSQELDNNTTNDASIMNDGQTTQDTDKRYVPVNCAICLMEYDVAERVCWASNPDCTHVFHEDCIVNWLVYLGRTKSKLLRHQHQNTLTDAQLLNYKLQCPCCRQEFVWKEAVEELDSSERL